MLCIIMYSPWPYYSEVVANVVCVARVARIKRLRLNGKCTVKDHKSNMTQTNALTVKDCRHVVANKDTDIATEVSLRYHAIW